MTYRLTLADDVPAAIRRAAAEQLDGAVRELDGGHPEDPVGAIHDVRKHLKKTRSLLRLARPGLRARDYRREDRSLRDRGRSLSGARDADVTVATIDALRERLVGQVPRAQFDAVRDRLAERAGRLRQETQEDLAAQAEALRELSRHARAWPVEAVDRRVLAQGLADAYRRGREAFAIANADPTADHLHEWRKRVKDLWYQLRLLHEAWPGVMKVMAGEAKALSEILGDDHDLAVLAGLLRDEPELTSDPEVDRDRLLELVARRRSELLEEARSRARRLYAEAPKAFRLRIRAYVRAAARQAAPEPG